MRVYLDHNATTPLHPQVLEAMMPYLTEMQGNAASIHSFGREAARAVDEARAKVAAAVGCDPEEIIFTSGGTEADNLAIKGIADKAGKGHIITSAVEHPAVLEPCRYLEKRGFALTVLPVDSAGRVDPAAVAEAIRPDTVLVTIMTANNEIGTIQPVAEIAAVCRERGVPFHTDAVQAVGKIPFDVRGLGVDMASISAHKFYGPKGVGALYVRKGIRFERLLHGGHQERGLRAGTTNVPGVVGMGAAIERALAELPETSARVRRLRDALLQGILERVPAVAVHGDPSQGLPNTLNVGFQYIEGEGIILGLDAKGIAASTGSACTSGTLEPSHVILAIGVPPERAQGAVRFSLGAGNTQEEIEYVLEVLPPIIERLRAMSPLWRGQDAV